MELRKHRYLLEKLVVAQLVKKFPTFYGTIIDLGTTWG
jgi:predicted anti-sigma-YlaC factor YlaD